MRGSAFAIYNLTDDLGKGGGPVLVTSLVHWFGGRQAAYNISVCFWFVCAIMCWGISFTLEADENRVQVRSCPSIQRPLHDSLSVADEEPYTHNTGCDCVILGPEQWRRPSF